MQPRFKYPRTPLLPWSPGGSRDDLRLDSCKHFEGKEVVVSEKMDGECSTLYRDGLHARSTDSRHHASRAWLKAFHAGIALRIPEGWRLCGEYLYARHSIAYDNLPSYFLLFSVWTAKNCCLSWREMEDIAGDLGLARIFHTVGCALVAQRGAASAPPTTGQLTMCAAFKGEYEICGLAMPRILYLGAWNEKLLRSWKIDTARIEGYVVRTAAGFSFADFGSHVAKWVRAAHVQTDGSWRHRAVVPNTLAKAPSTKGSRA